MYVTDKQLRSEIRELLGMIRTLGHDHGAEFQQIYSALEAVNEALELQQEQITDLFNRINNIAEKLGVEQEENNG